MSAASSGQPGRGRIAVVGAGWAGCAAAVELARRGHAVTLLEAARTVGGRARRIRLDGRQLDNGQHILLGAYRETLRLMRRVGLAPERALLRLPLQMRYPAAAGGMDLAAARLPAPLHLALGIGRARGLPWADKLALARFATSARWMGWQLHADCSVTELLERFDQTERAIRLLWRPLCIAALNTLPEQASAQVFLNVLRDSLGAGRHASDLLIPRLDLSALFPERAAAYVEQRGGALRLGAAVTRLLREDGNWKLEVGGSVEQQEYAAVLLAVPPSQAASLAGPCWGEPPLPELEQEAILTCYLQYAATLRLEHPMYALLDDAENREWGQFVFDRGRLNPAEPGLLAVVVSAAGAAQALGQPGLAQDLANQLARAFALPQLAQPEWSRVVAEKRATFSCTPGLRRPPNASATPGLALAGDYTAGDYPATLEGAVRSGLAAARLLAA